MKTGAGEQNQSRYQIFRQSEHRMILYRYLNLLWRWLWLLLLMTFLSGGAAYAVSIRMTPVYEASTTLLINQAPAGSASPDYNAVLTAERLARTYAEMLVKRPVLEEVVHELNLPVTPAALGERVRVRPIRDTQLIVVTVEDVDPQRAADVANRIVAVFSEQNRELQSERFAESKRSLMSEIAKLQADINATQTELAALRGVDDPVRRARLEEALVQYRSSYATVLRSLEEVRLAEAQLTNSVNVVETAIPVLMPVRPRIAMNTGMAAVAGLLLAIGLALLFEYLNDRVSSAEDVATAARVGMLAAIGRIDGVEPSDKLVMLKDPFSQVAEAYQMLRVKLEIARFEKPMRTLLVTSSSPGEGKSTTAANLALAIARSGKRVILVDTDLRRPSLHRFFRHANLRGVTTALVRDPSDSLYNHMIATSVENLLVLPSGPVPSDPAVMVSSRKMLDLIGELQRMADVVVFDSPPLLAVADAIPLAHLCDVTLLVVLAGATRTTQLRRAYDQLLQAGVEPQGVVLNRVTREQGGYDHYYYYYGGARKRRRRGVLGRLFRRRRHSPPGVVDTAHVGAIETRHTVTGGSAPSIAASVEEALPLHLDGHPTITGTVATSEAHGQRNGTAPHPTIDTK
ncbi:polysaccharide biosynthesis tyrosine autokinase [Roseiflexus sp.]|uniref:polysaccharide biosynthesis tyrosine autokinase n=1 Tax=Roseiflexus sp. TaxID=2562120 RepID=UPI00398BAB28